MAHKMRTPPEGRRVAELDSHAEHGKSILLDTKNQVQLAAHREHVLWQAHCRAAALLDAEPGIIARAIFDATAAQWRDAYLRAER